MSILKFLESNVRSVLFLNVIPRTCATRLQTDLFPNHSNSVQFLIILLLLRFRKLPHCRTFHRNQEVYAACLSSAQSTCSRTSDEEWSFLFRNELITSGVDFALPSATAIFLSHSS